eukprot:5232778-Heterocapsa_arctica.AAC.1
MRRPGIIVTNRGCSESSNLMCSCCKKPEPRTLAPGNTSSGTLGLRLGTLSSGDTGLWHASRPGSSK